jgi:hypothetical protein
MAAPVVLGLLVVPGQYPGATAGLLFRGLVLLAGWRCAREPPAGAWATFRGIRDGRGRTRAEVDRNGSSA